MTNDGDKPNRPISNRQEILFAIAAILVPAWALVWGGSSEWVASDASELDWNGLVELNSTYAVGLAELTLGAAFPFGLSRIALAYLFCCLPLTWWTANRIASWLPENSKPAIKILAAMLGAGMGLAVMYNVLKDAHPADYDPDGWTLHIRRIAWVFGLQLPWLVAARLSTAKAKAKDPKKDIELAKGLIALSLGLVAPLCYAESELARQIQMYDLLRKDGHLLDAWFVVKRLNTYGASPLIEPPRLEEGSAPSQFDRFLLLRSGLPKLEKELAGMINARINFLRKDPSAHPERGERIARAQMYIALGQPFFDFSERILKTDGLSDSDSLASSILGNIRYWQKDFVRAIRCFRNSIDLELAKDAPDQQLVVKAFNNIADCIRASEGNLAAEEMLKKAIEEFPAGRAALTYALGVHYQTSGRPLAAITQFEQLVSTSGEFAHMANQRIEQIRNDSAGCLIW